MQEETFIRIAVVTFIPMTSYHLSFDMTNYHGLLAMIECMSWLAEL